jgi:hypothetical protein
MRQGRALNISRGLRATGDEQCRVLSRHCCVLPYSGRSRPAFGLRVRYKGDDDDSDNESHLRGSSSCGAQNPGRVSSRDDCQGVVEDLSPLAPFVNVLSAEQRHSASIAQLFTSIPLACAAAADRGARERRDVRRAVALTLPADVRQVYENIRLASLSNHLSAFERCS